VFRVPDVPGSAVDVLHDVLGALVFVLSLLYLAALPERLKKSLQILFGRLVQIFFDEFQELPESAAEQGRLHLQGKRVQISVHTVLPLHQILLRARYHLHHDPAARV